MAIHIFLFAVCLVLVLGASEFLAQGIDRIGLKLHLSDDLIGVLTALGADSPEISSAIVAVMSRQRDLGVGIVLGSNLFNLAALLGLGAVIAGEVSARAEATIFNGSVAVVVTLVAGALMNGFLGPDLATALILLIVVPYIYILSVGCEGVEHWRLPAAWKRFLIAATRESKREQSEIAKESKQREGRERTSRERRDRQQAHARAERSHSEASWKPALWVLPALAAIVLGSIGLIRYATELGKGWLPQVVLGTFVLASLTGLPNSLTAVRLARHGKGSAVITETFNSNTINLLVGLLLPALIFGEGSPNRLVILDIGWLVLMTVVAVVLSAHCSKLTRNQGIILIVFYAGFIASWCVVFLGT